MKSLSQSQIQGILCDVLPDECEFASDAHIASVAKATASGEVITAEPPSRIGWRTSPEAKTLPPKQRLNGRVSNPLKPLQTWVAHPLRLLQRVGIPQTSPMYEPLVPRRTENTGTGTPRTGLPQRFPNPDPLSLKP
jgi:hypothetical protein